MNDKRFGKGVCKYANGDVYEGDWDNDKKEGKGVLKLAEGQIYLGEWKGG